MDQPSYNLSKIRSIPFIGLLPRVLKNPLTFALELSHEYGDIIEFTVMGQRAVQLNHPDLIRHVLIENHKNYRKSKPYIRFESALGLGLLTSNGDKWRRDRQKIQPLFARTAISGYHYTVANEVSERYKQKWLAITKNGPADIDITEEMANITTEVILKVIFGKDIDEAAVSSLHHSYNVMLEYLKNIRLHPKVDLRKCFHTPAYRAFKKELDSVNALINDLSVKYKSSGNYDRNNMLALVLEAQKKDPDAFSDRDVRDHVVSMVFAGFESTSILMQWLWYALDERPDILADVRHDIISASPCTGQENSTALTFEELQKMDLLGATIKETLRLYPSFWLTGREPIEDEMIGDYKMKKGTAVVLSQFAMHRHPKWWPNANSFMPGRFMNGNDASIDDGCYFPFSLGPRKCSGFSFVDMEARTIAAKLLPAFDFTCLNKACNPMYPGVSLKLKHNLRVRLSRAGT